MATINIPIIIEIDKDLNQIINQIIDEQNITKDDFVKQAIIDKLEDIRDSQIADLKFDKWIKNGKKTYNHEEMMKRYG